MRTDCRLFDGYRPCRHGGDCEGCAHVDVVATEVLLVSLGALGDVLRTTALLPAVHRAFPAARLTWLTRPRAAALLERNPLVDRVIALDAEGLAEVLGTPFDVVLNPDKDRVACAVARRAEARERRGFIAGRGGVVLPASSRAEHLWRMGLDDRLKFRDNDRVHADLVAEALGLEWRGEEYVFELGPDERAPGPPRAVGFNTGAAWPRKALALDVQEAAIRRVAAATGEPVLLLGGPEDRAVHDELERRLGPAVERTPLDAGLRRGAAEVARCEVVVTGDSLGMHLAIATRRHVVAWFGPTSPQEIHLYGRGVRLLADVDCAPCWRPRCDRVPACNARVAPEDIERAVLDCLAARRAGRAIDEWRGAGWWRPPRGGRAAGGA